MGKIAVLVLVVVAVMLVLRLIGSAKRRVDDSSEGASGESRPGSGQGDRGEHNERDERRDSGELMMSCSVCGVHVPASDAVFARGKVFCSADHRDAAERHGG
jgi:uncharacterized protein